MIPQKITRFGIPLDLWENNISTVTVRDNGNCANVCHIHLNENEDVIELLIEVKTYYESQGKPVISNVLDPIVVGLIQKLNIPEYIVTVKEETT